MMPKRQDCESIGLLTHANAIEYCLALSSLTMMPTERLEQLRKMSEKARVAKKIRKKVRATKINSKKARTSEKSIALNGERGC